MPRQPVKDVYKYRGSLLRTEPVAKALASIANEVGLHSCPIGPYYMPPWKHVREYRIALGIVQAESSGQLGAMKKIAQLLDVESHMIVFDGDIRTLTDLVTKEKSIKTERELQNYIMNKVSALNPGHPWDPATMTDDSKSRQFTASEQLETEKLKLFPDCLLDYTIRSIPSDNIAKLDIDVLFYDPTTYEPKFLAETKMHWRGGPMMNFSVTKELGRRLNVPAGLIFIEGEPKYKGFPFGWRGYGLGRDETGWDKSSLDLRAFVRGLLNAPVPDGDAVSELTSTSGRRSC